MGCGHQIDNDLGIQIGPDGSAPQYTVQNTYQLVENLNWTKGKHTLKIGFDGRNVISPQHFIQRERGDYNWSTLEARVVLARWSCTCTLELSLKDTIPDDFAERNLGNRGNRGGAREPVGIIPQTLAPTPWRNLWVQRVQPPACLQPSACNPLPVGSSW